MLFRSPARGHGRERSVPADPGAGHQQVHLPGGGQGGLGELVRAVTDARREGRTLEIDETLSPQVRQVIELLELQKVLWPTT